MQLAKNQKFIKHSISEVSQFLHYEKETGVIRWIKPRGRVIPGDIAGKALANGYLSIKIFKKDFLAHRLAWAIHYQEWPEGLLDHINGNRTDNRISNLRCVSHSLNCSNRTALKNGKPVGAFERKNVWIAQIKVYGKLKYLGTFNNAALASQAYQDERQRLFSREGKQV